MKIAILHMTMGLTDRGSERVIDQIANLLSKKNDVLVFRSGPIGKSNYRSVRVNPLTCAPPTSPSNFLYKPLFWLKIDFSSRLTKSFTHSCLPRLHKYKPDIIIAVNGGVQVKIIKKILPQSRVVVFGHAGIGHDDMANLRAKPNLFIALSPQAYTWAQQAANSHTRVIYLPNPIDLASFRRAKPIELKLRRPIILTVGALSKYKNILNVIRAISYLRGSFILIGDGEGSSLVASALSRLSNEFKWIKHLKPDEMAQYYKSADVFCLVPNSQEAFGLVYLEAMAANLPIVASDDPIRRSIIGAKGFYANPHDINSIVSQIIEAAQEDKVNYDQELNQYKINNVVKTLEKEFYELGR